VRPGIVGRMGAETTQDLTPGRPTIASLADVRPGDLIFTQIDKPLAVSLLVKLGQLMIGQRVRIGRRSFDHVIVVTEAAVPVGGTLRPTPERPGFEIDARPPRPAYGMQAMPRGAEQVELTGARHWTDATAVVRLPETYPGQALDVARIAREFVAAGVEYSFGSYLMLAAWRWGLKARWLEERIARRLPPRRVELPGRGYHVMVSLPAEAICSVAADQCWTLAGKQVIAGVPEQVVTPGKLTMSLWRFPGAIWGGPGILG
jgi:hypothetical protein